MKYFLIFLLSFVFIGPALAAKQVNGTVPKVSPLQPAPLGVYPNVSNNIEYHDSSQTGQLHSEDNVQSQPAAQTANFQDLANLPVAPAPVKIGAQRHYFFWLIVVLAALGLAWVVFKKK